MPRTSDTRQLLVCLSTLVLIAACTDQPTAERNSQRAGQPVPVAETAARIAAARAAGLVGDQQAAREQIDAITDDVRRSMKVPDPARPIDREAARAAIRTLPEVRSVVWLDATNLLAVVASNEARSEKTIDAICLALEPLGDTLAVVVNLQSTAAQSGDDLETRSRNCQLEVSDRAFMQRERQVDVISPELRAQFRAQQKGDTPARRKKAEESARIMQETTPELGESR